MSWYNLTSIRASKAPYFVQDVNTILLANQAGNLILIALWFITFFSFQAFNQNAKYNFMFSSGIIAILSLMFKALLLIPDQTLYVCWAVWAISFGVAIIVK